ncbi:MAG: hypothetical protein MTP17_02530 [Candidatus Midichloria sp.]|nr:MAG: hypothetical protein MTP17_02530 [Candidatus Midichloria sp.]
MLENYDSLNDIFSYFFQGEEEDLVSLEEQAAKIKTQPAQLISSYTSSLI